MPIVFIITSAGRAALVNARHDGTNAVRIASCGLSATAVVAGAAATTLPGEFKRVSTISGAAVAADVIHVVVRDESGDAYSARSLALYLNDGTLFGLYGQAEPIINKAAGALALVAIDVTVADISAAEISFGDANFLVPPATITTPGVVELADDAEAVTMADAGRAVTPRGLGLAMSAARILARLMTVDGGGSGLDADLLDGLEAVQFLRKDVPSLLGVDAYLDFVSSAYGQKLRIGGNSNAPLSPVATIFVTDGNLHLDAKNAHDIFLNFIAGRDVIFGNYAAIMSANGTLHASGVDATAMKRGGLSLWGPDNHGSNSGLDADTTDGWHRDAIRDWNNLLNRPGAYPPSAHTHAWIAITDKPSEFPPALHSHAWDAVVGKPVEFPPSPHTHAWDAIVGKPVEFPPSPHAHAWSEIADKPAEFPPSAHSHVAADIAGAFATNFGETWSRMSPDGFIEMGGIAQFGRTSEGAFNLVFPVAFPNACLGVSTMTLNTGQTVRGLTTIEELALYNDHAELFAQNHQTTLEEQGGFRWRAWGH